MAGRDAATGFGRLAARPAAPRPRRTEERIVLRFGLVVIGAADLDRAERFWCQALGYDVLVTQLGGSWRELGPENGSPVLALQRSHAAARHDPRLHVDLNTDSAAEQAAEAGRLIGLGAERVDWEHYPADPDFIVLADTEGNRFCVVDLSHGS
jgi:catechol 2,3-dioxygenase-like lactoylglutathione lyase family enzyme